MLIIDSKGRIMDYARISVTDRCNFRCVYCMPGEGVALIPHGEIMRFEDIIWLARALESLGVRHVRFTGGEPLVRRGMAEFLVSFRKEFPDMTVSLTTNASALPRFAPLLSEARLSGMNISLDTLDPIKFAGMTRTGNLEDVLKGIDSAAGLGIDDIKTNTVLIRGFNDAELPDIIRFAWEKRMTPRVIEFMPMRGEIWGSEKFIGSDEIMELISAAGDWTAVENETKSAHGPAKYFMDLSSGRRVGVIEAVSNHFCSECNRIRITASGNMRACLFNNAEIPLLDMIRLRDRDRVCAAILEGINGKPEKWRDSADGAANMSGIGG
jgi:cyclic pyranopterin phosphate synthase